jgi:hypothetical protein
MEIPEYDFDAIKLVKEGFKRIEGVKQPFIMAFSIYVAIAIILYFILGLIFPSSSENPNIINQQIVGILSYPVLVPLLVGIMMMAINHHRNVPDALNIKNIFNYYHLAGTLAFASLLIYLMTMFIPLMIMLFPTLFLNLIGESQGAVPILMIIGMFIFLFFIMYLSIVYIFTLPLIADKGLSAWEAMELSRRTAHIRWAKIGLVITLLSIVAIAGILSFGIILIWAIPLFFVTIYGILYVRIFDEEV